MFSLITHNSHYFHAIPASSPLPFRMDVSSFSVHFDALLSTAELHLNQLHLSGLLSIRYPTSYTDFVRGLLYSLKCIKWTLLEHVQRTQSSAVADLSVPYQYLRPRVFCLLTVCCQLAPLCTGIHLLTVLNFHCQQWAAHSVSLCSILSP